MSAPIHVLHPPRLPVGTATRVALAPIVGSGTLGAELEQALIAQQQVGPRPLQIVTAQSLAEASPLRLVSTAALTSELTAIHAARAAGADVLMLGEVVQDDLQDPDASGKQLPAELSRLQLAQAHLVGPSAVQRPQRIAVAWRVFDVQTGRSVGSHTLAIDRIEVDRKYPDLQFSLPLPRERVLAGSARQTWQSITPYVERENVVLDLPWLQPGAARVRQGNGLARQGRWDLAEAEWTAAVARYPYSNAAKHNLALAQVSREDFSAAKETLGTLGPLRSRKRQAETLVWIDQRHRWHHAAMGLPTPEEGWSFPEPTAITPAPDSIETAADPWEQPWWTAIPFTKPPGWSWRQWYFQPWAL